MFSPDTPILILTNDQSTLAAKTSSFIATALRRQGAHVIIRDTAILRQANRYLHSQEFDQDRQDYEIAIVEKFHRLIHDFGIQTIISLDLHWLFSEKFALSLPSIHAIHCIWFDDLRTYFTTTTTFPLQEKNIHSLVQHEKVHHYFYGASQKEEAQSLGITNCSLSHLAAPLEYTKKDSPESLSITNRAAFVGNPGLPTPPTAEALQAIQKKKDFSFLRHLAQKEILSQLPHDSKTNQWLKEKSSVRDLLESAMNQKIKTPYAPALHLILQCQDNFPDAFHFLNETQNILDAALLIKSVNRYDRPAVVVPFYQQGLVDVFSAEEEWNAYGVQAKPFVPFSQLPQVYQAYTCHINAPNCARDATANEKLFEIAACGRLSFNPDSPDLKSCYDQDEAQSIVNPKELEQLLQEALAHPQKTLERGIAARRRTQKEHTWDHRVTKLHSISPQKTPQTS